MKFWIYSIALALLPVVYVGLMLLTGEPIDWSVLGWMAVIVLPIIVFRKSISKTEDQFNALSDQEKRDAVAKAVSVVANKTSGRD